MFETFRADLLRAQGGTWQGRAAALRTFLNAFGLQALAVYRLGRWLRGSARRPRRWPVALLLWPAYGLLCALVRKAYDVRIELSADVGPGLIIHHFGGIRLRACRLGSNCVIHHEVRLEPEAGPGAGAARGPLLGDRIWIGPHARVLGPIQVGSGATLGAGADVERDVPSNALMLGSPARVARLDYDNASLP